MKRYALRCLEYLAIAADAIKRDADGFFLMMGPDSPDTEAVGSVLVVHIRGALSHFATPMGDSYEAIVERVGAAMARKPSHVVLRIESPGGVVSGLNETVFKLRKMSAASGIPLLAFIDEMAASAAFAICCACEERFAPPSAVVGSVGVISTMASQVKADAKDGVEFVLITSGARKADGHPHGPITDAAVEAERGRVQELASQFFALASDAVPLSPKKLASLEAGLFLGRDAMKVGLIDDVMSWDALMAHLDDGTTPASGREDSAGIAPNEGNQTDRSESVDNSTEPVSSTSRSTSLRDELRPEESDMSVKLAALVAKMAAETDPTKVTALLAEYGMLAKAEKPDDDEGDDKDKGDDDDEDSKSSKHAARAAKLAAKAKATGLRSKAAAKKSEAAALEEEAKKCEEEADGGDDEEEEEEKKASLPSGGASAEATAALARLTQENASDLAKIKADIAKREQSAAIREATADGRITPAEAKMLGGKTPQWAAEYIATREGVRVVNVDEGHLVMPKDVVAGAPAKAELAEIDARIAMMGVTDPAKAEKLRNEMIANRQKAAVNGDARY